MIAPMDLDGIQFEPTRYPGVSVHFYHRDPDSGHAAALIRMRPGSRYPRHRHRGPEEVLVLEGGFRDEHGTYRAGQFVRFEDGSVHWPQALDDGPDCVLFAIAREGIELLDR